MLQITPSSRKRAIAWGIIPERAENFRIVMTWYRSRPSRLAVRDQQTNIFDVVAGSFGGMPPDKTCRSTMRRAKNSGAFIMSRTEQILRAGTPA